MAASSVTNYDDYIHEPNNQDLSGIPGDEGLPLIGHTAQFYKDPYEWAQKQYRKYGPVFRVNVASGKGVVALGPDLMQRIYLDPDRDFSSKMGFMDRVAKFFPGSLIMEDFEHHKAQRRIFQTAFKSDALKDYTRDINTIYQRALTEWEAETGKTVPFFFLIKNLLLEVAAEVFIGETERGERVERLNQAFIDALNGMMYLVPFRLPGTVLDKGLKGSEYLQSFVASLIAEKRDNNARDMLSLICKEKTEEGEYFRDEDIVNQIIFLLFAAHDTTTAAVTHTMYYLARNPEIKERLYQECLAVGKPVLEYEDLASVPYMQQVFFEVQRIRTSTPLVPRRTIREVTLAGVTVPAHTMVYTVPRFTHFMEEYWREPERFDPDRFSPERAEHKQHPFVFHPFGGGAHKCIGMHFSQMEYKCFLHQFLLKYDFVAKHKKEPFMQTLPLPKPTDDMPVELIRR
ncbi:cytochrome P450 [Litorivivens sp.]|uniref:cytochrome P450 n=1 Tax=Litorivivens sp. TaxID=2020868 RepID=UPI003562D37D